MPIGQLLIELGVNMGAFQEGLSKATYQAKQFGKEVQTTFAELGENIGALAGSFGLLGPAGLAAVEGISLAGQAAGKAMKEFASMNRELGVFAAAGAGAAVAAGSIAASAVGLAVETAKSVKEMDEQAKQAGINITQFSQLAFAAKQAGVAPETLVKGLDKLQKNAVSAAQGNKTLTAAFAEMIPGANAQTIATQSATKTLAELADWFQKTPDSAAKTALEMQVFGGRLTALAPLLDRGSAGIQQLTDDSDALGTTLTEATAESSAKFTETLQEIQAAGQGAAIAITSQLLPSLQAVASSIVSDLKKPDSGLKDFISGIVTITKGVIDFGHTVTTIFDELGIEIGKTIAWWEELGDGVGKAIGKIKSGDVSGAGDALKEGLDRATAVQDDFYARLEQREKAYQDFRSNLWKSTQNNAPTDQGGNGGAQAKIPQIQAGGTVKHLDDVDKMLQKQQEQYDAQIKIANGVTKTQAALELANAALEAGTKLSDEFARINNEINNLVEQRANTGNSTQENSKIDAQIKSLKNERTQLGDNIAAYLQMGVAAKALQSVNDINKKGDETTTKYQAQIDGLNKLAAAAAKGGDALIAAQVDDKLSEDKAALEAAKQEQAAYADSVHHTAEGEAAMATAVAKATANLEKHREQLTTEEYDKINAAIASSNRMLAGEVAGYSAVAAAADKSLAAQREAAAQAAGDKARGEGKTTPEVNAAIDQARQRGQAEYAASVQAEAANDDLLGVYARQVEKLNDVMNAAKGNGVVQLQVAAQLYDANNKMNQQWDEAAMKAGDFGQKVHAALDEVRLSGQNFTQGLLDDFTKTLDDLNSKLVQFTVTGKVNFKELRQSLESSLLNTGLKKLESTGAGELEKLFGGKGSTKPDGSQNNPFYVVFGGGAAGAAASAVGALPTAGFKDISSLLGLGGGEGNAGGSGSGGPGGGLGGFIKSGIGLFSKIFSAFGGFLADGGRVTPGKTYVVGEKHPEFFTPGATGQVSPALRLGGGNQTNVANLHLHGIADADSFRKNRNQIMATLTNGMGQAARRQ